MLKKILSLKIAILMLAQMMILSEPAQAAIVPISAPTAILIDNSNQQIYYSKTPHLRRAPASTTKILTAIVVLDYVSPDKIVTIPKYVEAIPPSKIYLRRGERYRAGDLVKAILTKSANDAAEALAYSVGGSREGFAKLMNAKARALGCRDSNFVNPSGLPDSRQYSTVYDMSLIVKASEKYPLVVQIMKMKTGSIRSLSGRKVALRNHNKMLWRSSGVTGKTGWTRAARHCFVGTINRSNKKVFVAILGSQRLWRDLKMLIDYHFGPSISSKKKGKSGSKAMKPKEIQLALKRAGYYNGPITGTVGPLTRKAIKKFQKAYGIQQTGTVGPITTAKLKTF